MQLHIAILNLMPLKEQTEQDFIRLFDGQTIPVVLHWMRLRTHTPKHASPEHMDSLYQYPDELAHIPLDGLIITGAPVEQLDFEDVTYWPELCQIMDWAYATLRGTVYVCWAAQAGLYHHFGIRKYPLPMKKFGIFRQELTCPVSPLFRGMGQEMMVPHSRHTEIRVEDVQQHPELTIVASAPDTGPSIIMAREGRDIFITGHIEYATGTLDGEYQRDVLRGRTDVGLPVNYYPDDNPDLPPQDTWGRDARLFYANWLNKLKMKN